MDNIRMKALSELAKQFPDDNLVHYVAIFKKPDMSYGHVFTTRFMLVEIERMVQREYPGSSIEEIGYIWPHEIGTPRMGYVNDWDQYKIDGGFDPRKNSVYSLSLDQDQPK